MQHAASQDSFEPVHGGAMGAETPEISADADAVTHLHAASAPEHADVVSAAQGSIGNLSDATHVFGMEHQQTHNPFELWTEDELSEKIGVPTRTLQRWRVTGRGPRFTKMGMAVRYRPSSVLAWLDEQERDPGRDVA